MDNVMYRDMKIEDYYQVYSLWNKIKGFKLRSIDDDYEHISKFLIRNDGLSVVAACGDDIIGSILVGSDGRQAVFYHVCVDPDFRGRDIGEKMVDVAVGKLKRDGINKITLIAFKSNTTGNKFWKNLNWTKNNGINSYEFVLNEENILKEVV